MVGADAEYYVSQRKYMKKNGLILFIFLLATYGYLFFPDPGDNVMARMDLIYSIVHRHSFNIDAYYENTVDVAYSGGHYYSSGGIGTVLPGAALLFGYNALTGTKNADPYGSGPLRLITLVIVSLPAALLGLMLYMFLGRFGAAEGHRAAIVLAFSLGTLILPYSTLYYTYLPSAALCFGAFLIIERYRDDERFPAPALAAAGFFLAYSFISSYESVLIAAPMALYLFFGLKDKRRIMYFILGAIPPAAAMTFYNHACFGNVLTVGNFRMKQPEWSALRPRAYFSYLLSPKLKYLWYITFLPGRGLFWLSPFLLFCVPGFVAMFRQKGLRRYAWLFLFTSVPFFLANAGVPNWEGGYAPGPRYLTPAIIFISIPIYFWFRKASYFGRSVFIVFCALSILHFGIMTLTDPHIPESIKSPFFAFSLPLFLNGYTTWTAGRLVGLHGPASLLPYAAICVMFLFVISMTRRYGSKPGSTEHNETRTTAGVKSLSWFAAFFICAGFVYVSYRLSDVSSRDANVVRAAVYLENGFNEKAIAEFTSALGKKGTDDSAVIYDRGIAYQKTGNYLRALDDYNKAIALSQNNTDARIAVARLLKDRFGDTEGALKQYRYIINHTSHANIPVYYEANMAVGTDLLDKREYDSALKHLGEAHKAFPDKTEPLVFSAAAYMKKNDLQKAAETALVILKLDKNNAFAKRILLKTENRLKQLTP